MHSEQPLPRAPGPWPAARRPAFGLARTAGLYGEVVTLPVSGRGTATPAERKSYV